MTDQTMNLKKTLPIVVLALLLVFSVQYEASAFWPFTSSKSPKTPIKLEYSVNIQKPIDKNWLNINPFFVAENLYDNIFYTCNLVNMYTVEEKAEILGKIMNNLPEKEVITLVFEKFDGKNPLLFFIGVFEEKGEQYLILKTNYNKKTKKILTNKDTFLQDGYEVAYRIVDGRLVFALADPADVLQELLKENDLNNLATYFMFDDNVENDAQIEGMLNKYIASAPDPEPKYIATMTLAEYYIMIGDFDASQEAIDTGLTILKDEISDRKDYWKELYTLTTDKLEITKMLIESSGQ